MSGNKHGSLSRGRRNDLRYHTSVSNHSTIGGVSFRYGPNVDGEEFLKLELDTNRHAERIAKAKSRITLPSISIQKHEVGK